MTYASSAWSPAAKLEMNRAQFNAVQRGFAQKVCKAYRTVSLTSALVLSGLLPLDLRIEEAASLYRAKKGISRDYLPPDKELELRVGYLEQPHPSTLTSIEYELLENTAENITGPQIYTDGSKIQGQVGAALTWWEEGGETQFATFKLHPSCTVFQSELYALSRATQMVVSSKDPVVSILSDSRSSLDLLRNPKLSHPLVRSVRENIDKIVGEGREVRMFWLRAHIGTAGNERADELAKTAALSDTAQDYDKIPLSFVRKKIREESIRKWQDRYETSSTGAVTKRFLPSVDRAYRMTRSIKLTPTQVQFLTGHGGIAEYLHRFKLKDSPGCECDEEVSESVWHIILHCPRFLAARQDLETRIDRNLVESELQHVLEDPKSRPHFLSYAEKIFQIAARRNSTLPPLQREQAQNSQVPNICVPPQQLSPSSLAIRQLLAYGEKGTAGIRIRGVALFMDDSNERLGISFCFCRVGKKSRVAISPGLASLMNGSTSKTTMRYKTYSALPLIEVENHPFRLVRLKNKTIALLELEGTTPFARVGSMLSTIGELADHGETIPRIISVDALAIEHATGEVVDRLGCLKASAHHEVVVYENRGESLNFLRVHDWKTNSRGPPTPPSISGSERIQQRAADEREALDQQKLLARKKRAAGSSRMREFCNAFSAVAQSLVGTPSHAKGDAEEVKKQTLRPKVTPLTTADMVPISPPSVRKVAGPVDHAVNAFREFMALTRASAKVNLHTCQNIWQAFEQGRERPLQEKLEEAEAAIYNSDNSQIIRGKMSGSYMAAYSATCGFVALKETDTEKPEFATPENNPIVVTARCTKIMLDDRILEMGKTISGSQEADWSNWTLPQFRWINGVPGCGKTTWVVGNFNVDKDIIITSTTEAANDIKDKLARRIGDLAQTKVRTMASVLVNGFREPEKIYRLTIDEALMNHFGAIIMAARLSGAGEIVLIGDINQLPYIDRLNVFEVRYNRPTLVTNISQELLCTHRNPMDVAYALREAYSGMYSSKLKVRSLKLKKFTGAQIPNDPPNTLFLVHTQEEKETLKNQGYGEGTGSRLQTIHEAQGLSYESVVVINTKSKMKLHESVPHAVVAISRHTSSCTYYTDDAGDAIGRFIERAMAVPARTILDYNLKMSIKDRNAAVWEAISKLPEHGADSDDHI